MRLAQELVDYIIDFLHDNPTTLLQLSLVSRAWVDSSRIHLCETMKITRLKLMSLNPSYLTPLCRYAKILHFTWPKDNIDKSAVLDRFERSKPHTLAIRSCELHHLDEQTIRRYFAKFPCTSITTLELHLISPTFKSFLILLSLFPNVDNLSVSVHRFRLGFDQSSEEVVQRSSPPPFGGSFKFFDFPGGGVSSLEPSKLLRTIAVFPLQFQTVSLDAKEQSWEDVSIFLSSCSKTVRKVYVKLTPPGECQTQVLLQTVLGIECANA